jgi:hypothetical protein
MNTPADKTRENKSQSISSADSQMQNGGGAVVICPNHINNKALTIK